MVDSFTTSYPKLRLTVLSLVTFLIFQTRGYGQDHSDYMQLSANVQIGLINSTDSNLPFWLHSNRWGLVDRNGTNGFVKLTVESKLGRVGPVGLKAGTEFLGRVSEESSVFFNEVYLQADWKFLRFVGGRKKERIGITDSSLTSGSMIQSGNASPITKIRFYTPEFVGIPGTANWVSFKGYFSHGWMEHGRFIENPLLHQKYLYFKVFPQDYPVELIGGIVQSTLWAGTHPEYGNLPDNLDDFWNVFTAQSSDAIDAEPTADVEAVGSSIGIYDFGIKYKFDDFSGLIHRQFYLETGAGAKFRNVWDGLWGVSISWDKEFQYLNKLSWSYLYTKRQSSQEHRGDPPYGADGYYGNSIYKSGWTYHGRTIGNALMFTDGIGIGIDNNIVIAQQASLGGRVRSINYKFTGTYSRNYGSKRTVGFTGRRDQYSILLQTSMKLNDKFNFDIDLAYDTGELYPDQVGTLISLSYKFQ